MVTIVMAMYKPNITWLKEQLISLNQQEYSNLELLVWNDCPEDCNHEEIFKECITKFPYKIIKGMKNLGSIRAFEELTILARGKYTAYCDQDDVWYPNKISTLVASLKSSKATLACSDACVINDEGKIIASKITDVRPRQTFVEGDKQIKTLLVRDFVLGCTMLINSKTAKNALPFPRHMGHDHWLALWNAVYGKIIVINTPLIEYRVHGNNQSMSLAGVITKDDYFHIRCLPYYMRLQILLNRDFTGIVKGLLVQKFKWAEARVNYYKNPNLANFFQLLFKIHHNAMTTGFELLLPFMPKIFFDLIVRHIRNGDI